MNENVNDELNVIIAPQYRRGSQFSKEGFATVKVDGTDWGVIDTQGRLRFSIRTPYLTPVSEGFCFGFEEPRGERHGMIISIAGDILIDRLGSALSFSEGLRRPLSGREDGGGLETRGRADRVASTERRDFDATGERVAECGTREEATHLRR